MARIQELFQVPGEPLMILLPIRRAPRPGVMDFPDTLLLLPGFDLCLRDGIIQPKRNEIDLPLLPPVRQPAGVFLHVRILAEKGRGLDWCRVVVAGRLSGILPARCRRHADCRRDAGSTLHRRRDLCQRGGLGGVQSQVSRR